MDHLKVQYLDGRRQRYPLRKPELFLGRDATCDIAIEDGVTSRRHARFFSDPQGQYWIQDLHSKNGVRLNDRPVTKAQVKPGDSISIGTCRLTLVVEAPSEVVLEEAATDRLSGATSTWRPDEGFDLPRKRLQTLYELNERLTGRFDRADLLNELLDICCEQLRLERVGIALWSGEPHPPQWIHLRNLSADASGEFRISRSVVDRALHHAERILIVDTDAENTDPTASMISNNIRSAMCVPLEHGQRVHGVLYGDRVTSSGRYEKEDIDFFAALGRLGAMGLANVQLVEEMRHRQRVETQFALAREIQAHLFPAEPLRWRNLDIAALNDPGQKVSGDYYDYFVREDERVAVVIADVSGKGMPASLLMANLQAAVRIMLDEGTDLPEVVGRLNRLLCQNIGESRFITAIFGLLDLQARLFTCVNAGHPTPYLIHRRATLEKIPAPESANLPIGISADHRYEPHVIELGAAPATLVLYTDGVPEAESEQGGQFEEARFAAALEANLTQPPAELVTRIRRSIKQFTRNHPQSDDITLLAVELA